MFQGISIHQNEDDRQEDAQNNTIIRVIPYEITRFSEKFPHDPLGFSSYFSQMLPL